MTERDDGSFEGFYTSSKDDVFRTVLLCLRDRDLAEEATAEAFVRALAHWGRVGRHPNPAAWVVTTALNYQRSRWRRHRRVMPPSPDVGAPQEPLDPTLLAALSALPERQRQVVALRFVLDLSTEQTASALGISTGTVTKHVYRAVQTLREHLDQREMAIEEE